jgi:hypothetical protein
LQKCCSAAGRADYEYRLPHLLPPVSREKNIIQEEADPACYLCNAVEKSNTDKGKNALWREPGMCAPDPEKSFVRDTKQQVKVEEHRKKPFEKKPVNLFSPERAKNRSLKSQATEPAMQIYM